MNISFSSIWRGCRVPGWECHLVSPTAEVASLGGALFKVWWWWCAGIGSVVAVTVRAFSLSCGSACCVVEPLEGFSIGHVVNWLDVSEGEVVCCSPPHPETKVECPWERLWVRGAAGDCSG